MKRILFISMACCLSLFFSCVEDTGNYNYLSKEEAMPIKISGLEENIEVFLNQQLHLTPKLSGMDKEDRYTFSWWAIQTDAVGFSPKNIMLGTSKELNLTVKLEVGDYNLNIEVRNVEQDTYVRKQVKLKVVASDINAGWYVLKDKNNETDFDYINMEGKMQTDVLVASNKQLKGTARGMVYQDGRYVHIRKSETGETTRLADQKVFHIISSEDFRTFNAMTLELFKTFNDHFYVPPTKCDPQFVWCIPTGNTGDIFLMNAGNIHSLGSNSPHAGKLGGVRVGDYSLFPHLVLLNFFGNILTFDEKSHSFFQTSAVGTTLDEIPDQEVGEVAIPMKEMPYTMMDMFSSDPDHRSAQQGFALLKGLEEDSFRIAEIPYGSSVFLRSFNAVASTSLLTKASVRACTSAGNFIYFAIGNKVHYYMNAPGLEEKEQLLVTLPAGETVSYMKHVFKTSDMNVLAVLVNTPTHWKLYIYKIEATGNPELEPEPMATYTGEGVGRFIMYRAL